jgi:hypothetical protein
VPGMDLLVSVRVASAHQKTSETRFQSGAGKSPESEPCTLFRHTTLFTQTSDGLGGCCGLGSCVTRSAASSLT